MDLFAGGPEYTDSVFRRLGILTERDSLYATIETLIDAQRESLPLGQLPLDPESTTFNTLVSSGILQITLGRVGTTISFSPEFTVPLFSLTILRHQTDPPKLKKMLEVVNDWMPEQAITISKIVEAIVDPGSGTPPAVKIVETEVVQPTTSEPKIKKTLGQTVGRPKPSTETRAPPPRRVDPVEPKGTKTKYSEGIKQLIYLINDRDIH
ncbi:MAG: hypothetical protein ACYSWU_15520, partial [Planctomycetota bacterium]